MDWFPILFWSGPIGIGAFLAGLGVLFWGLARLRDTDAKAKGSEPSTSATKNS